VVEAIELAAKLEGLVLDPVYTGKALSGLIGLVRAGRYGRGEHLVFMHTGGMPGLFAYREDFLS
jgi:1-aminocyclopropane-1-carboxylate deaminase/D-cysteine desulfhydrase-like pyridoxal-dependent ACC family enzyme